MPYPIASLLIVLLFQLAISPAHSENLIYQWFEKNKAYFSDRPHPHAKVKALTRLTQQQHSQDSRVKLVVDGDTIHLEDGTKVRLLGINTPEVSNHYHHQEESGGRRAKQWLTSQLTGQAVRLEMDEESQDRYGRTLAHVFTKDGVHINAELLALGLATVSLYPPNLKYADALIAAQTLAESHRLGIWNDPAYAVKTVGQLNADNQHGWQRITGVVQNIRQTRRYFYLEFSASFSVRISRSNARLFPDLNTYVGKSIEVRGMINQQEGQLSLLIRHPDALRLSSQ